MRRVLKFTIAGVRQFGLMRSEDAEEMEQIRVLLSKAFRLTADRLRERERPRAPAAPPDEVRPAGDNSPAQVQEAAA